jgi:uncharacterized protein YifE (UPF0438 family)
MLKTSGTKDPTREKHIDLLVKHLNHYRDLHYGTRKPETSLQQHFVDLLEGRKKKAITIHERAYLAYLADLSLRNSVTRRVSFKAANPPSNTAQEMPSPKSGSVENGPSSLYIESLKGPSLTAKRETPDYARFVEELWGTRKAWKRDSGANRSNAIKHKR